MTKNNETFYIVTLNMQVLEIISLFNLLTTETPDFLLVWLHLDISCNSMLKNNPPCYSHGQKLKFKGPWS
jgi:hypothetical protein